MSITVSIPIAHDLFARLFEQLANLLDQRRLDQVAAFANSHEAPSDRAFSLSEGGPDQPFLVL